MAEDCKAVEDSSLIRLEKGTDTNDGMQQEGRPRGYDICDSFYEGRSKTGIHVWQKREHNGQFSWNHAKPKLVIDHLKN